MPTFRLTTELTIRNPVRVQVWNCSIRRGDDFRLALTVLDEDTGQPSITQDSRSRMALWPERNRFYDDYGWRGLRTWVGADEGTDGYWTAVRPGGINFAMTAEQTSRLHHPRYLIVLQIDLAVGVGTQIEGVLQVRGRSGVGLGHHEAYFQLDHSALDNGQPLADLVNADGVPINADGFPLLGDGIVPALVP